MKRRSFFSVAAAASGAAVFPSSSARAASDDASPRSVRTAISLRVRTCTFEPTSVPVDLPVGFIPVAASCAYGQECRLRFYDDEGDVMVIDAEAFKHGPLDFWREPKQGLHVEVTPLDTMSVYPAPVIVIYGEIDID